MADSATKQLSINGGTILSDMKSLTSLLKTRRTVAFAYGFMFAFVAFTLFLAFNPSPNSYSPSFVNIFSSSPSTSNATSTDSNRSQFSSIFSYLFPNSSSTQNSTLLPQQNITGSKNTTFSLISDSKNQTQTGNLTVKSPTLKQNQSVSSPVVNKQEPIEKNQSLVAGNSSKDQTFKPNQTIVSVTPAVAENERVVSNSSTNSVSANKGISDASNSSTNSVSAIKGISGASNSTTKSESSIKGSFGTPNYTASLSKKPSEEAKQSNGTSSEKKGIQSLINCEFFDGEWVKDDSYPLYKPGSCSLIDEQFNCIRNGRPDKDYQKYKWKPKQCTLPRLEPGHMLDMLRGKRLVFVGDSLNRNMWESLVCILKDHVKDKSKVFEANGRQHFKGEASYSFVFKDYNCTVEFFVSPFLVREWELPDKNGAKKETLRLDLVGRSSDQYKGADIIVFNTGHWWTHDKTSKGKDYYQEGSHVYEALNVLEAFRKALTTWSRWVDANVNPMKSLVFFRGYSASHFSGGQWNSGGACDSEVEPIKNSTYLKEYPPKMLVLENILKNMKTHVTYLNITRMTDYRKDGHPSVYRKQNLSPEERKSPLHYQDCSHWCLPGVPDAWNEILYAELLVNEHRMRQVQKRHR